MPIKKGTILNPKGRPPKGEAISEILRELAYKKIKCEIAGKQVEIERREALARKWWAMALDGDLRAGELLVAYIQGKPKESVELNSTVADMTKEELNTLRAGLKESAD